MTLTITNHATESQTYDFDSQYLYDAAGRKFDADMDATIVLDDSNAYTDGVNPGNGVKVKVVFDMPKTAQPAVIELHDSMFSGGVKVSLR